MMRETFPTPAPLPHRGASPAPPIDLYKLVAIVRRQWRIAALSVAVFLLLGIVYLLLAAPKYSASTDILIDQDNSRILYQGSALERTVEDEARILSQVEVLTSDKVGLAVVDKLKLDQDPNFMSAPAGPLQMVRSTIRAVTSIFSSSPSDTASEDELRRLL